MNAVDVFQYADRQIRTVTLEGEPWFVLNDVCKVLGISNPHNVASRIDSDALRQMEVIDSMGRTQKTNIVDESGLYEVIIRSDSQAAAPFRRWITREVLPAIRKTGAYVAPTSEMDQIKALHAAVGTLLEHNEKITARAVQAESFKTAIERNDGLTPREFHKSYLSEMPERAFFDVLYACGLLIDQRGQRYDKDGKPKPGKQHGHPSFTGKQFFYLHTTVNRSGDRFENTRVRPGEAELSLAEWFAKRGHPVNAGVLGVAA